MTKGFYILKPIIPRRLQLFVRRQIVRRKRMKYADVWPIDERASKKPVNWKGWPEGKQFALTLTHDVETAKGHGRCRDLMYLEQDAGFRSSFNFAPEQYRVSPELRCMLIETGFEIGLHGLLHDCKDYYLKKVFKERAEKINKYLKDWNAVGYRAPSMLHKLDWFHDLNIEYDASTFDTDPFEPQPEGMVTIFPFWVSNNSSGKGYVELPYTLPQDFTLFILMKQNNIDIWKKKLDWIANHGGMVLINVHPDYLNFSGAKLGFEEYPANYYADFLEYVDRKYEGQFWHVLPKDMARYWKKLVGATYAKDQE